MTYYIELTLIDSPDFSTYQLWSKLYQQLHLAFVEQKDVQDLTPYGVSFPQYRFNVDKNLGSLGAKLRIFASSKDQLETLNLAHYLKQLLDYVHITSVREVPKHSITGFACYYRARPKNSIEQRILHQAKRRNISVEEAVKHFEGYAAKSIDLPFIGLNSASSAAKFKLIIGKVVHQQANIGKFGTYGLSREHTVPEF